MAYFASILPIRDVSPHLQFILKGEKEDRKYEKVRGERTPMPPRGDKRREDFEKWYAANVR